MKHLAPIVLGSLLLCMLSIPAEAAGWSDDPTKNLAIADLGGDQVIPLVASTSDGGIYVAWFDDASGNYDVYLQRLDASGNEQWAHDGIRISDHPQDTALFGWDMIADSHDNAVLVFSDVRDGGDLDIHAYKIDPAGQSLWGPDGVTLSDNPDFEPRPQVAEASDGDFVFVWQRDPDSGDGDIRMQRLSPAGVPRLASGGASVVSEAGKDPAFVAIAPSDDGSVTLCWLRDIRSFLSRRYLRAQKFSATGSPLWPAPVEVYDLFSLPLGYGPDIQADGAGGALLLWHRSDGSFYNSFVQHLDSSGVELFPHEGASVSTTAGMHHLDPTLSYLPATGESFVFWNERNSLQSQWGIYGQKLSPSGARMWAPGGVVLLPVSTQYKSFPRSVPAADGAMVFLTDQPGGVDRLIGMRVSSTGAQVWPGSVVVVSSAPGGKARYPVTMGPDGVAKLVWEDERNPTTDVYGQNVRLDGTLGIPAGAGAVETLRVDRSVVPGDLRLTWTPSCSPAATNYAIYEGLLGSFYSHVMRSCDDLGSDRAEDVHPAATDAYYLVVPTRASTEGSYGTDGDGVERPAAAPGQQCAPAQVLTPCP